LRAPVWRPKLGACLQPATSSAGSRKGRTASG
jgi:hypothetical protein